MENKLETIPKKITSKLTVHQKNVYDKITNIIDLSVTGILKTENPYDYMLSLTGAAGTGKTFLTAQIASYLKSKNNLDYSFTITAPTHKAVSVISGMLRENKIQASCKTIHSFLGIKPFVDYNTGEESFTVDKTKKSKDSASILIVDESSMIGSKLFEYITEAIEDQRVNCVFFIGDPYQLLPVDKTQNQIYQLRNRFTLTEVVRQAKDSYIINIATKLRERIAKKDFINLKDFFAQNYYEQLTFFNNYDDFIKDFHKSEKWYIQDNIIATHKNKDVDAFNKILRTKFWEQKEVYNPPTLLQGDMLRFKEAYSVNEISLYHNGQIVELQSAILKWHETLEINFWECRCINAPEQQIFRVVDTDSLKVFNDKLTLIAKHAKSSQYPKRDELWKTFYAVRDMFADVQYIHSSTIHKLQGSTHDIAYVDLFSLSDAYSLSEEEKYRLTYVAITRARKDIKIFIPKIDFVQAQPRAIDMNEKFGTIDDMIGELSFLR